MKIKVEVRLTPALRNLVGGADRVQTLGQTVGEALDNLDKQFPGFRAGMIDKRGKIKNSILVALNDEDIRCHKEFETPLKEGDILHFLVFFSGG